MAETVDIAVSLLQLDPRNARLSDELASQQQVYDALAKHQGRRLVNLAEDIVKNGLDPTTVPAVTPTADRRRRYKVIEGNRRVLALKALETPTIVAGALAQVDHKKLVELSHRFAQAPIEEISCVLFDSEEEARHWVELRHTGANEGAGLVEWGSEEKDRFQARHGSRKPAGQVIEFVEKVAGAIDGENKRILSNVDRLISSTTFRDALGLDVVQGRVVSYYPAAQIVKPLKKIVEDLKTGRKKVNDIYYDEDRKKYLKSFGTKNMPTGRRSKEPVALDDLAVGSSKPTPVKNRRRRAPKAKADRSTMVPQGCSVNPTPPRINAIYNELAALSVDTFPNSCAVLLRVFLELSVDHEITSTRLMTEQERNNATLAKRLKRVAAELRSKGRIDDQLKKAIDKIADGQQVIAASTSAFNQYVHNQYVHPKPSELRTAWDELQPFFERLWP